MLQNGNFPQTLRYLFTVIYKDGTEYSQTPEDVSVKTPEKSAFADIELERVRVFSLSSDNSVWSVDLVDGSFSHNGVKFFSGEPLDQLIPPDLIPQTSKKLIYYRKHTQRFNVGMEEQGHIHNYVIGYEINLGGKNIKRTIEVE